MQIYEKTQVLDSCLPYLILYSTLPNGINVYVEDQGL